MYRVINVAGGSILSEDIETLEQAYIDAAESESHESEPEVAIQEFRDGEWVQIG